MIFCFINVIVLGLQAAVKQFLRTQQPGLPQSYHADKKPAPSWTLQNQSEFKSGQLG